MVRKTQRLIKRSKEPSSARVLTRHHSQTGERTTSISTDSVSAPFPVRTPETDMPPLLARVVLENALRQADRGNRRFHHGQRAAAHPVPSSDQQQDHDWNRRDSPRAIRVV